MIQRVFRSLAVVAAMLLMALSGATAQPATPVGTAAEANLDAAVTWLLSQQQEDGGFPGFEGESDPSVTVDAVLALTAAAVRGQDTAGATLAAMDFLEAGDTALVYAQTGAGQAAKLVLAAVAADRDPRDIAGVDALSLVAAGLDAETGLYGGSVFSHALALLALVATGSEVPEAALTALADTQGEDGGWGFDGSVGAGMADTNTTAMVTQALVAVGGSAEELLPAAIDYLTSAIGEGGATYQPGGETPPDSSSTALALQAAIASGQDLEAAPWSTLAPALATFQNAGGAFHFNADDTADNLFSTVQAIPAVAGIAFPVVPAGVEATPIASPVALTSVGLARAA